MNTARILIVEDDPSVSDILSEVLSKDGYEIDAVADGPEAIERARRGLYHLYLLDLRLPSIDGIDLMQEIKRIDAESTCIVLTGFATIEMSVRAMREGAFDFITKPFHVADIMATVKNALAFRNLKQENLALKSTVRTRYRFDGMIGDSPKMHEVFALIAKVADTESTILIQGESGTGKEVVAKTIHFNSRRMDRPLIPVNCGAIPESLLESELFGHEKGAFTGATSTRMGRFELAHGGTLFLDEIGEMPPALQVKLLRVLQEREFVRVGGTRPIRVDIRIIAATNQDLELAVTEKRFREDLFYRLNVIQILLPALREHPEDIPLFVDEFVRRFNHSKGRQIRGIAPDAMTHLLNYHWPGNVRELENLIERMVILKGEGMIELGDLPEKITKARPVFPLLNFEMTDDGIDFSTTITNIEAQLLRQALLKANGVKNRAAQLLRLNRTTLVEKLKKHRFPQEKREGIVP